MSNVIRKLPMDLCNQISAGEVIERPANIVKELLENSIDAGASAISVHLEQGGLQSIIIQDNGTGMGKEDLSLALERHATSKIKEFSDLYALNSFGFRGEALSSIASVAKVQISSALKIEEEMYAEGNYIRAEYGNIVSEGISPIPFGTEISIEDLFLNIPVRLKFLSSPVAEQRKCLSVFTKIALANSGISFTLYAGGREYIHFGECSTVKERLERIWAAEIVNELRPIQERYSTIALAGYCSTPKSIQKKSDKILVYVNKRPVQDKIVLRGIREAYKGYITTKEYPCVLLFIDIAPEDIDVNVHPAKTEIRFRDEGKIIKALIVSLRKVLQDTVARENGIEESQRVENGVLQENSNCEGGFSTVEHVSNKGSNWSFLERDVIFSKNLECKDEKGAYTHSLEAESVSFEKKRKGEFQTDFYKNAGHTALQEERNTKSSAFFEEDTMAFLHDSFEGNSSFSDNKEEQNVHSLSHHNNAARYYTYLSVLYKNYLLFLSPQKELLIIDQHAAHERVLEHIIERNSKENIQHIMIPIRVAILPTEWERVDEVWESLCEMGFLLEKEEHAIQINGIPSGMLPAYAHVRLKSILLEKKDSIEDIWHRKACTSAVKSGDILSEEDCYVLLEQWLNTPNNICCPHGRPIAVHVSLGELQKLFKRHT
ncbi:MAG: DNA mismatch repair endonuclease MutL [Desulfovibrionaceae bacterium]